MSNDLNGAPTVFLACPGKGITRAEKLSGGEWHVSHLIRDLKVACVAETPAENHILYAGTSDGVIRSEDAGKTWEGSGLRGHPVKSIAVSPHDPNIIFAGSKPAILFRSSDGGKTWRELDGFRRIPFRWWWFSPADPPDRRPYVFGIAPSPVDPQVLLAGVEFGAVVRSEDGGESWSRHRRGALRDCHSLKFHSTNGDWAYEAGGSGGGASYSQDGGVTWTKAWRGLKKKYGIACGADAEKPEIWYVCVGSSPWNAFSDNAEVYLYRSNGGAGWRQIGWEEDHVKSAPTALVSVPGHSGHLYAGLFNGDVMHTEDYGETWMKLPFNLKCVWFSLAIL